MIVKFSDAGVQSGAARRYADMEADLRALTEAMTPPPARRPGGAPKQATNPVPRLDWP